MIFYRLIPLKIPNLSTFEMHLSEFYRTKSDRCNIRKNTLFMVKLYATILKPKPNQDGSYTIRIAVSAQSKTVYILTRYRIDNLKQWNGSRVIRHPNADVMNRQILALLSDYEMILSKEQYVDSMTAKQVRELLEQGIRKSNALKPYAEGYISKLKEGGQKSYAQNMGYTLKYLVECFGENMTLQQFNINTVRQWERYLFDQGNSSTTVNIRMSHLKALLNAAVNDGVVEYKIFPFRQYRMPTKNVRDICISMEELEKLREASFSGIAEKRLTTARDLFLLSFYCAGINLTDIVDANLDRDTLTFVRKKTADKKQGEKSVSITIQPEARTIIDKYITPEGKLDFGYHYSDYGQFRSFVTKSLNRIGEMLGFEKKLMYYSARKTFCQFGYELGIPLYVLEYAIGQTIKDANNRPIFNYIKIMRKQADFAIRTIIDYSLNKTDNG